MSRFDHVLVQALDSGDVVVMDEHTQAEVVLPNRMLSLIGAELGVLAQRLLPDSSNAGSPRCNKPVGSKPWWMGVDQYDPCRCLLSPGHDGACRCLHGDD